MSKRKKKGKRQRSAAIKAFGLKDDAYYYETAPFYQSSFQEGDMGWLADEYQRRSRFEPTLTLEDFAAEYGVSADTLRFHAPDLSRDVDHSVVLWHGTTKSRAESILEEGFRVKRGKKQRRIYFAGRQRMAHGIAQRRATDQDDLPVVIRCSIDLSRYDDYERRGNAVYAFRHECIGSDVIEEVTGLPKQRREKPETWSGSEATDNRLTNVVLTFNSGRAGIAYWINNYPGLEGPNVIYEEHETVVKIKDWMDEQMDSGRFGEVPEDEILEQLQEYERTKESYQKADQS